VAVIGDQLSNRNNSLNFLRLVLALTVVVSHAIELGRFGDAEIHTTSIGSIAVYGFFGISGYLIAASANNNGLGRYLWQRFLRIFPGFWVCLLMVAFVFGVIAWVSQPHPRCGVLCYLSLGNGPTSYVARNAALNIRQIYVVPPRSGSGVPWQRMADGSLWTLYYEFLCYLILGGLAVVGLLRRRIVVAILAAALCFVLFVIAFTPRLHKEFNLFGHFAWMNLFLLSPIFMVGAAIYLYRDRVPDSGWLALACAVGFTASLWLPGQNPVFEITASDLFTPLIVYPMLWLGIHVPLRIGAKNDYSYGLYVYAWPVTVLLAIWGLARWGVVPFVLLSVLASIPFAVASWWLVERRALSLKRLAITRWTAQAGSGQTELR
jgi:peptidoglycan/LPS O-acetylase OafA/YrhL